MIALTLLVVFVVKFFWLLVALAVTVMVGRSIGWWLARLDDRAAAQRRRDAEIVAARTVSTPGARGGYRGVYGAYPRDWTGPAGVQIRNT